LSSQSSVRFRTDGRSVTAQGARRCVSWPIGVHMRQTFQETFTGEQRTTEDPDEHVEENTDNTMTNMYENT